jgi:hypothetical protein
MTFQQAVAILRGMDLGYKSINFEVRYHDTGEVGVCCLYTERFGGVVVYGSTWEEAFILLEGKTTAKSAPMECAPL